MWTTITESRELLGTGMGCQIEYGPGGTVFEREPEVAACVR
jgi:hypothetical protein